jgi:hypothetical protein
MKVEFSNPKPTNEMKGYHNLLALKNAFIRSEASSARRPVNTCVLGWNGLRSSVYT